MKNTTMSFFNNDWKEIEREELIAIVTRSLCDPSKNQYPTIDTDPLIIEAMQQANYSNATIGAVLFTMFYTQQTEFLDLQASEIKSFHDMLIHLYPADDSFHYTEACLMWSGVSITKASHFFRDILEFNAYEALDGNDLATEFAEFLKAGVIDDSDINEWTHDEALIIPTETR